MNDLELKNSVEQELKWEPSINAAEIGVTVKNGIVTLNGRIESYWEKIAAERAAWLCSISLKKQVTRSMSSGATCAALAAASS